MLAGRQSYRIRSLKNFEQIRIQLTRLKKLILLICSLNCDRQPGCSIATVSFDCHVSFDYYVRLKFIVTTMACSVLFFVSEAVRSAEVCS